MEAERFLLKWNNHQSNLVTVFDQLYEQEAFTDVTLACDGRSFASHKVILSACSPYFQSLFLSNPCKHPIIFMRDVKASDLDALLAFMYRGEINVHQQDLASFLKTAESLQIKGLSDSSDRPRDTSKILEAMEKKFNSSANRQSKSSVNGSPAKSNATSVANNSPPSSSTIGNVNSTTGLNSPSGGSISSSLSPLSNSNSGYNNTNNNSGGMFMPGSGLLGHGLPGFGLGGISTPSQVTSSDSVSTTPPNKKLKTALDDLPRILPKMKGLIPPSLVSSVPGLLTPMTLANVMKGANLSQMSQIRPPTPETTTTDSKLMKKEKLDIFGDLTHPAYLMANAMNNSGKSTPNLDVKIEEEEEMNSYSDEPFSSQELTDDMNTYKEELLGAARDKLTYPCRFCGKRFTQTGTCRRHERLHTSPNSFKCPFCNKGFNRKYRLKEHILASHPQHVEDNDVPMLVNSASASLSNSLADNITATLNNSNLANSITNSLP